MRATFFPIIMCLTLIAVPARGVETAQAPAVPKVPTIPHAPLAVPTPPKAPIAPVPALPPNGPLPYVAPMVPDYPDNPTLERSLEQARNLRARHRARYHYHRKTSEERAEQTIREAEEAALKAESKSVQSTVGKLLEEFGPNARCHLTENFIIIYDTTDLYAAWCGATFEEIKTLYEAFALNLRVPRYDSAEPMIVILFAQKEDYEAYLTQELGAEYANRENKPIGMFLEGKNRSVVYDISGIERTKANDSKKHTFEETTQEIVKRPDATLNISTLIHEITHQVAFDRGLFMRGQKNPTWAVEGIATLFEGLVELADDQNEEWNVEQDFPLNKQRKEEYLNARGATNGETLRKIVAQEKLTGEDPAEYPAAWALFYYLYKNEPRRLAQYLFNAILAQPRAEYPAEERVRDFEVCFGNDWQALWNKVDAYITTGSVPNAEAAPQSAPAQTETK